MASTAPWSMSAPVQVASTRLGGRRCDERRSGSNHETWLTRWLELPTRDGSAKRGARRLAGQGTEARAAEVAITAGCFCWHAKRPSGSTLFPLDKGAIVAASSPHRKGPRNESPAISGCCPSRQKPCKKAISMRAYSEQTTPVENSSPG